MGKVNKNLFKSNTKPNEIFCFLRRRKRGLLRMAYIVPHFCSVILRLLMAAKLV